MFGSVQSGSSSKKPHQGASPAVATSIKKKPAHEGRERLKYFDEGIRAAHDAIEDLEQRIARFDAIIAESENATRDLQNAINSDGGLALAAYSSGTAKPNDPISKLVAHAKSSTEAATAAKIALPTTEGLLENAKAQLVELGTEKHHEVRRVLAMLADKDARDYQSAFDATCVLHDKMCGYASVCESNQGDIRLVHAQLFLPRFATPSMGSPSADQYIRHSTSDLTLNESARRWSAIRSRLESDADADISDLT